MIPRLPFPEEVFVHDLDRVQLVRCFLLRQPDLSRSYHTIGNVIEALLENQGEFVFPEMFVK